jgi:hypothetical protein
MLLDKRVIRVVPLAVIFLGADGCKSLGLLDGAKPVEASRPVAGFEAVAITGGVTADVAVGGAFALKVEGNPALTRRVETRVEKGTLLVVARPRLEPKTAVRVRVVLPRLVGVSAHDGSTVTVGGVAGGTLVVRGAGGSRVVVAGTADLLECTLSDASRGDARELAVGSARVSLAGASRLDLRPRQVVSGEATGASKLAVWSKPKRVGVATRDGSSVTYVR